MAEMKKLFIVLAAAAVAGCYDEGSTSEMLGIHQIEMRTLSCDGHDYVVASHADGIAMVHSPSCGCHDRH